MEVNFAHNKLEVVTGTPCIINVIGLIQSPTRAFQRQGLVTITISSQAWLLLIVI